MLPASFSSLRSFISGNLLYMTGGSLILWSWTCGKEEDSMKEGVSDWKLVLIVFYRVVEVKGGPKISR